MSGVAIRRSLGSVFILAIILLFGAIAAARAGTNSPPVGRGGVQASDGGTWGPVLNWINAVHLTLLPNGKVIMYDEQGNYRLYDPAANLLTMPAHPGYIAMCGGMCLMADGSLFVMGGGGPIIANALKYCSIYNPFSNTWADLANMNKGRWYGVNITLPNGNVLVTAGAGSLKPTQVWQASGDLGNPSAGSYRTFNNLIESVYWYPRVFVAPNGMVFDAAPDDETGYYDLRSSGRYVFVAESHFGYRKKGTAVMYRPGKIILIGGAQTDGSDSTPTCEVIDLNEATPQWRYTTPMNFSRKDHTAISLPDGRVLVVGGYTNTSNVPTNSPEVWDPDTEQWTVWAPHSIQRGYHGTTALLPDGRIIGAGGNRLTAQIFSPPYLNAGPRPTITTAPDAAVHGDTINITTPDAANVKAVNLIRLGSTTHNPNFDQRFLPLEFTKKEDGSIDAVIPANQNVAIVGYYMLFLIDQNGVPSVGKFLRVAQPDLKAPDGLVAKVVSARTIDIDWNDNSSKEVSFAIRRSTDGINFTTVATVPANVTGYRDTPLESNTTFTYQVFAVNSENQEAGSNVVSAKTPILLVPQTPGSLRALAQSGPQVYLSWVPKGDLAYEFIIERSQTSSGFTEYARVDASVTSYIDLGVLADQKYYYRMRAANPVGTSPPSGYVSVVVSGNTSSNTIAGLNLAPLSLIGGKSSTGIVTLTNGAVNSEEVTLWTDRADTTVPASISIPDGETTGSFTIETTPQLSKVIAHIFAKVGTSTRSVGLTIYPAQLYSITYPSTSIVGGSSIMGTVNLNGKAPAGGITVYLSSNNAALVVPASVVVPEGQTAAYFTATSSVVYANVIVTTTGSGNGVVRTRTLTVKQHTVGALSCSPNPIKGGLESTGKVTLTTPAGPGGVIVNLTSDRAEAVVPSTVAVPEGQTFVTFPITTSTVAAQVKAYLKATINTSYRAASLTINP
jgi:hypothetical protein